MKHLVVRGFKAVDQPRKSIFERLALNFSSASAYNFWTIWNIIQNMPFV
jgi:hypothetical protein